MVLWLIWYSIFGLPIQWQDYSIGPPPNKG